MRTFMITLLMALPVLVRANGPDTTLQEPTRILDNEKVEMEVAGFSKYLNSSYEVFLKEVSPTDNLYLPIIVGGCEASALSGKVNDQTYSRPLTYDLCVNTLDSAGVKLLGVVITKLQEGTFYARRKFELNGRTWEMDARPSDSMNLAVRMDCKIYAYRKVMTAAREEIDR